MVSIAFDVLLAQAVSMRLPSVVQELTQVRSNRQFGCGHTFAFFALRNKSLDLAEFVPIGISPRERS